MGEPAPVEELRAQAERFGVEPADADLAGVRDFLAVFLPAVEGLTRLLPADAPGPAPLGSE